MASVIDILLSRGVDTIYFLGGDEKIFDSDARCLGYLKDNRWVLYPKPMGPALDDMRKRIIGDANVSSNPASLIPYSLTNRAQVDLFTMLYTVNY
ncbi:hypothetical protein [Serratia sp. CY85251]|uniref:hypothetical protein n=1 Tax=Serratia sp. CY85251 TaxID=3383696 RepID=UPI003FA0361E